MEYGVTTVTLSSERPVVYRGSVAVHLVYIGLDNGEIPLDHIKCTVAQQLLQGIRIAAIAQVLDRAGVAETMDRDIGNAGAGADGLQQVQQTMATEGASIL